MDKKRPEDGAVFDRLAVIRTVINIAPLPAVILSRVPLRAAARISDAAGP